MSELLSLEEIERISRCWGNEIELFDWVKLVETARAAHELQEIVERCERELSMKNGSN